MAITTVKYGPHPINKIFPPMDAEEKRALAADIGKNGLQEPIILFEGKVLDGIHRQEACASVGVEPRYGDYEKLNPVSRGGSPLDFVVSRNLKRRHLSASQRAMIAAELIPAMEKELAGKDGAPKGASSAEEEPKGRGRGGKVAAKAAQAMGVSPRSVERARSVLKKSPKKAAKIKAGKATVGKATRDISKEAERRLVKQTAIGRIEQFCGKEFVAAVKSGARLKGKDAVEFGKLTAPEMKRLQGLIEQGWTLKKARLYKAKNLTRAHKIDDLLNKAASEQNDLTVEIDGWRVDVTRVKSALKK